MKHLKIVDININSVVDYKSLDINQFISGSQVYDFTNGVCLVKTSEDNYTPHTDIIELTESEYNEQREIINSISPQVQEKNEIDELKAENEALKASQLEQDTLIMELILGGAV